ncbi:MAG: MBL fold metallo-hydrolase [Planctomycetota bacterium]|nr:MBL fold metallo-hydrolase [Planctomycetota bacterium]
MNLLFLGGAENIGASCALLELQDRRWVVDCGVRLKGSGDERLPELARLEDGGPPSAIFVTHAHLDHIGALPVLHQRYPLTTIYATPPTIELTRVQLLDSLRIMEEDASFEGELPLYSAAAVESLLGRMVPVRPLRAFEPEPGGPEVTFFPCGHIIGACSLGIRSREGSLFFSGDVSVDNQRTIPGMRAPRFRADVAVFESTYGNRLHPPRSTEEARLVATVGEVIASGGKVLIPAFAIGRAQEVILILLKAQLSKQLPEFPVHVDGMVRRTCAIYSGHPWYLQSTLRRRVEKYGDPFFGVLDTVRAVGSADERQRIVEGGPAVIVSSSGMLTGGPSPFYARALAGDPRNFIAITGYQDEEAPGRQILEVSRGERESFLLDGRQITPSCRIGTYALSGHASGQQIGVLARSIGAADVLLVHGNSQGRQDLANLFLRERLGRVHLPAHGEVIAPAGRRAAARMSGRDRSGRDATRRLKATGVLARGSGEAPTDEDVEALAAHVRENYPAHASFTVDEIHAIAFGSLPADDGESERFEELLRESAHFSPHPRRLFHFRPAALDDGAADGGKSTFEGIGTLVDQALPEDAGLLKKSYQPGTPHMTLVFAFPDVAGRRFRSLLDEVFRGSGWTFEIHAQTNPSALDRLVGECLPDGSRLPRKPALHLAERRVVVFVDGAFGALEEEAWRDAARSIEERTGFTVEFKEREETAPSRRARDAAGRLEINLAYRAIREAFEDERQRPRRIGKKPGGPGEEPFVELSFISPAVGERHREKLERLTSDTGWPLRISRRIDMSGILDVARELLKDRPIRKGPSFDGGERKVAVTPASPVDPAVWEDWRSRFLEETGYELVRADDKK